MKKRILVTWWGSLEKGEETIGDLFAVLRSVNILKRQGHHVMLASKCQYKLLADEILPIIDWQQVSPLDVDLLLFVCGPLIPESADFQKLVKLFSEIKRIALGVSVLPNGTIPFDVVIPRDGTSENLGDFAFTPEDFSNYHGGGLRVDGFCLRGDQIDYGPNLCLSKLAEKTGLEILSILGSEYIHLDTRLHGDYNSAEKIFHNFRQCRVVISTRLHGALLAIALGIPCIAIDQIVGGGKVSAVLKKLGWPLFFQLDKMEGKEKMRQAVEFINSSRCCQAIEKTQREMCLCVEQITSRLISAVNDNVQ